MTKFIFAGTNLKSLFLTKIVVSKKSSGHDFPAERDYSSFKFVDCNFRNPLLHMTWKVTVSRLFRSPSVLHQPKAV